MTRDPGQRLDQQDMFGGYPSPCGYGVVFQTQFGCHLGGAARQTDDGFDIHAQIVDTGDLGVKRYGECQLSISPDSLAFFDGQDVESGAASSDSQFVVSSDSSFDESGYNDTMAETIGTRLRRLRHKLKLRQWQVASETGLSRNFLSEIETDSACYSRETLKKLAAFYKISIDELELGVPPIPQKSKIVKDPVQIQLLEFFDALSPPKQEFFIDLIKSASKDARKL